ncbi:hypothetical protein AVEN_66813-1 [Araneus ventricosus]|uniref:Uncharacterized protein n=1 Tax=Araneus ventricosus TaxID=182803 RepID=A0A4Y2DNR7_ARAVE|nr:hypothetical protein AVEN_66813-1 [Araneus ventricosus]
MRILHTCSEKSRDQCERENEPMSMSSTKPMRSENHCIAGNALYPVWPISIDEAMELSLTPPEVDVIHKVMAIG